MWLVAKIKNNHSKIFQQELLKKINDKVVFYEPKVIYEKFFKRKIIKKQKALLENYIFCFNKNFKYNIFYNKIKYVKGLKFFLNGHVNCQNEILEFIDCCKSFEDKNGFITNGFFKKIVSTKAEFTSGPFKNIVFEIIKKQKNKLRISIGKFITTISDSKNCSYRPI